MNIIKYYLYNYNNFYIYYILQFFNNFINIIIIIYWIFDIFFYLILDIIYNFKLSNINKSIYINTNIDFLIYKLYIKFIYIIDSFYSWSRFPIEYYLDNLNYKKTLNFNEEDTSTIYIDKNKDIYTFNNDEYYLTTQPLYFLFFKNKLYIYFILYIKLYNLNKIIFYFPHLSYFFWLYFFFIFYFYIIIFYILNKIIYNNNLNHLNYSNVYNWDLLRTNTIKNNFNWYKNNNFLDKFYKKEIIYNDMLVYKYQYQKKFIKSLEKFNKKQINYYTKYLNYKNKYKKLINKYFILNKYKFNKLIYNKKFIKLKIISNKLKNLIYYLNYNSKFLNKKITFNFKNLMINNKYTFLNNIPFIEIKKIDLFFLFYYKFNFMIHYIYYYNFEEELINGAILFKINKKDYKYLYNKIYNLFFFYKWIDNTLLNNKGSIFFFHKDPTIIYIGNDNKNNKYYFNSSLDFNNNNFYFHLLFFFIPIFIFFDIYLSNFFDIENSIENFILLYQEHFFYWSTWFLIQYEILHDFLVKIWFSYIININTNIDIYDLDHINYNFYLDTWFNYNRINKKIFPLYNYLNNQHILLEESNLLIYNNDFNFSFNFLLLPIEYIYIFYDIFYIKFIKIDNYSNLIIFYNTLKFFLFILFFIYLYKKKNTIISFYIFNKININILNLSNIILNNCIKIINKHIK